MAGRSETQVNCFRTTSDWTKGNPFAALLLLTIIATLVYFLGFVRLFVNGGVSTLVWAWQAWNPETNYEHAKLIPLIVVLLVWYDRKKLTSAPVGSSRWGWLFNGFGLFLFFAVASAICNLIGIHVQSVGTIVQATDNAFKFEVDEGCSGICSLMAIAMLAAIYGHFSQDRLWKKMVLFTGSLFFAIVGNAGRLVSIFAVGRLFGQDLAGGPYHIISGYLSFPFAIAAMFLFGKLLNLESGRFKRLDVEKEKVSYDY